MVKQAVTATTIALDADDEAYQQPPSSEEAHLGDLSLVPTRIPKRADMMGRLERGGLVEHGRGLIDNASDYLAR